jgi:adenine-specific DNA-methyltransferase
MPRLTEQEQQEIIRFLEADKPLPEKYRFLLFEEKREVELVWNGKTNEVSNIVLPFQVIEQVDEPRAEKDTSMQMSMFDLDDRGRQLKGWTNKLIWGDNKLILSSLNNGPMREEIEKQSGIKLIYIDPPFDVGADFSMDIEIGDETFTKNPNILEEIAYRDTWGKGADSFIAMIYERLVLFRDLLAMDGSIYVHCDSRVNSLIRLVLDEVFGEGNFQSEIIWKQTRAKSTGFTNYGLEHNSIFYYTRSENYRWHMQYKDYEIDKTDRYYRFFENEDGTFATYTKGQVTKLREANNLPKGRRFTLIPLLNLNKNRPNLRYEFKGFTETWATTKDKMLELDDRGMIIQTSSGAMPLKKQYFDQMKGVKVGTIWDDIYPVNSQAKEKVDYPTQKPESLLERIIKTSTNENDIVADFFCGSGTLAAVAEKLGRKWVVADLGKFAIHTTRKRMIGVQRELKTEGKNYRAFEILNLGKYERQHYIGVNPNLLEEEQQKQLAEKESAFLDLVLSAYRAEKTEGFATFHGKKAGRLVSVGPVNLPVTRLYVEEIILECRKHHITRVDILGFEFEMGLFPNVLDEAREKGIDISPKRIPAEVFDKRAVEKNQVVFHDVAAIEIKPQFKGNSVAVELTDFSVFYSQDSIANAEETLKNKRSKIVVEKGQIVKVSKDKDGIVTRETLTKKWTDWIDYWSVDFDFESKRELIRIPTGAEKQAQIEGMKQPEQTEIPQYEEVWTGDFIFENEWQSFRTKKDRSIELTSIFHECPPGRRKIAVKVVDIFGNDTVTIIEVTIGGKK